MEASISIVASYGGPGTSEITSLHAITSHPRGFPTLDNGVISPGSFQTLIPVRVGYSGIGAFPGLDDGGRYPAGPLEPTGTPERRMS